MSWRRQQSLVKMVGTAFMWQPGLLLFDMLDVCFARMTFSEALP